MATKEDLHKLKITQVCAPMSEAFTSLKVGAIASTLALDTAGYESNMLVLEIGATAATNLVVGLYANDTSTATEGTIVTGRDVIFAVADNTAAFLGTGTLANNTYPTVGQFVQTTGLLTATTAPQNKVFMFAYIGDKRYIRLEVGAGSSTTAVYSVIGIQGHFRYQGRGGLYVEPYAHEA